VVRNIVFVLLQSVLDVVRNIGFVLLQSVLDIVRIQNLCQFSQYGFVLSQSALDVVRIQNLCQFWIWSTTWVCPFANSSTLAIGSRSDWEIEQSRDPIFPTELDQICNPQYSTAPSYHSILCRQALSTIRESPIRVRMLTSMIYNVTILIKGLLDMSLLPCRLLQVISINIPYATV
jgi:hypothetical protein